MRTDPTDTGGLFVGRRPGTAPIRYRAVPKPGSRARQRFDAAVAATVLVVNVVVGVSFWGPIPAAWLWVASMIDYWTGSVMAGIGIGFLGMILTLLAGLALMKRLDHIWILARRAAGHDQRQGVLGTIFAVSAAIGVTVFTAWLLLFAGLGPSLAPTG